MSTARAKLVIRKQIVRSFKKQQLTLQADAMTFLEDTLEAQNVPPEDLNDTLDNIVSGYVAREGRQDALVTLRHVTYCRGTEILTYNKSNIISL